jgi:hypothetical protein
MWVQNILLINVFTLKRLVLNLLTSRELVIRFYSISPDSLIYHLYFMLTYSTNKLTTHLLPTQFGTSICNIHVELRSKISSSNAQETQLFDDFLSQYTYKHMAS